MRVSPPFTGGSLRQEPLCSQPKLQKGRGPGCCCGHGVVPPPPLWCPCAMLFASYPFISGPLRQASLCSQRKLQKGRGPGCCCGHSAVPSPPLWCSCCGHGTVPSLPLWCPCAMLYSPVHHSPAVHCGKRHSAPSQSYRKGGSLAAAAATVLYRRRRRGVPAQCYSPVPHSPAVHCGKRPSAPSQSYTRGGIAAAAATALYCRRRCSVVRMVSLDNYDYRCTAAESAGYAPHTSSPRARLVGIARTRFPKPGRRNMAPLPVTAGKTNAAVGDDCRVVREFPSCWPFCLLNIYI